jgi:hypothetical protein
MVKKEESEFLVLFLSCAASSYSIAVEFALYGQVGLVGFTPNVPSG